MTKLHTNVEMILEFPGFFGFLKRRVLRAHNTVTADGLTRIRDALLGVANTTIGALDIYNDDVLIASTGMPTEATNMTPSTRWQMVHTFTSAFTPGAAIKAKIADTEIFSVAPSDFSGQPLESYISGVRLTLNWSMGFTLNYVEDDVPGSDSGVHTQAVRDLCRRVTGHTAGGTTGLFVSWRSNDSTMNAPPMSPTLDNPKNAVEIAPHVSVNFAADSGSPGATVSDITLPAVDDAIPGNRRRWYGLRLGPNILLGLEDQLSTNITTRVEVTGLTWGFTLQDA